MESNRQEAGDETVEFAPSRLAPPNTTTTTSNRNNTEGEVEEDNVENNEPLEVVLTTGGAATSAQESNNLIMTPRSMRPDPKSVEFHLICLMRLLDFYVHFLFRSLLLSERLKQQGKTVTQYGFHFYTS